MSEMNRITHISFPDVAGYEDLTTGIASGSLSLDEILLSGNIKFGEANANRFEVQLYDISDVAGQKIRVWTVDNAGTAEEVTTSLFAGRVDSSKLDNAGYYRQVIAYDALYYLKNVDISTFWNQYWESQTTSTLGDFRRALLDYVGLDYEDVDLINDDMIIAKTQDVDMLSFTELLGCICELNMCNPNINRSGVLEFIKFYENSTPTDITGLYRGKESSFEDFNTKKISQVRVYNSKKRLYGSAGTGTNVYVIQNNLFLYLKTESELITMAQAMFALIKDISYKPADISMVLGDFGLKIGDFVSTPKGLSLICESTYSGPLFVEQDIRSTGSDGELTSIESLVDQETNNTIAQHTVDLEQLKNVALVYLEPTKIDTSTIEDGQESDVLEWYFATAGDPSKVEMVCTLDYAVTLTDSSTPAVVTITYLIDDVVEDIIEETYAYDGKVILTLSYLMEVPRSEGTHFVVRIKAEGGEIGDDITTKGHAADYTWGELNQFTWDYVNRTTLDWGEIKKVSSYFWGQLAGFTWESLINTGWGG